MAGALSAALLVPTLTPADSPYFWFALALLVLLGVAALGVYGLVLGGWAANSTYPLLGSVRSAAQVISYELGMGISLASVMFMAIGAMFAVDVPGVGWIPTAVCGIVVLATALAIGLREPAV